MRRSILCIVLVARIASAEGELTLNMRVDAPVIAIGGIGFVLSSIFQSKLAPSHCRWCDATLDGGDHLNEFDEHLRNSLRWSNTKLASDLSSFGGFVLAPAAAFGLGALAAAHDDRLKDWPTDALVIVESMVLAADLNQIVKLSVGRARPQIRSLTMSAKPGEEMTLPSGGGNNLSFYSGHASLAFSLAVSSGTVASMRGYRWAPLVWATGLTVAAGVSYLRVAADKHYATDVIAGAAMGSLVGFVVPYMLHNNLGGLSAMPLEGGGMLMWRKDW